MSLMTVRAPFWRKSVAIALPMPEAPPVTSALFPESRVTAGFSCRQFEGMRAGSAPAGFRVDVGFEGRVEFASDVFELRGRLRLHEQHRSEPVERGRVA